MIPGNEGIFNTTQSTGIVLLEAIQPLMLSCTVLYDLRKKSFLSFVLFNSEFALQL